MEWASHGHGRFRPSLLFVNGLAYELIKGNRNTKKHRRDNYARCTAFGSCSTSFFSS